MSGWPRSRPAGHPRNTSSREKKKKTKEIHVRKQKTHGLFTNPFVPNIPMANLAATWFANNRTTFAQKYAKLFSWQTINSHIYCVIRCAEKKSLQYRSYNTAALLVMCTSSSRVQSVSQITAAPSTSASLNCLLNNANHKSQMQTQLLRAFLYWFLLHLCFCACIWIAAETKHFIGKLWLSIPNNGEGKSRFLISLSSLSTKHQL